LVIMVLVLLAAATTSTMAAKAPGRDPALLHKHVEEVVAEKEREQEQALRHLLSLGGAPKEQAEVTARLAASLRARGLALGIRAQGESDTDKAAADKDQAAAGEARAEAVQRYRELLKKYPNSGKQDEALFFLADTLQDSGKDDDAVKAARELVKRFPKSQWAPASHVFIGEHLFEMAKIDEALAEYKAAAEVTTDEVYPYALYKMAWCRFNQNAFPDAMKLLKQVVDVSFQGTSRPPTAEPCPAAGPPCDAATRPRGAAGASRTDSSNLQLAKEARRDYVLVYGRVGAPEKAREEFTQKFGADGKKMLEMYGKLLFDEGRDPEAQLIARQLLAIHGDEPAAALDQTRLLVLATRGGKRKDLLGEAQALVETFERVKKVQAAAGSTAAGVASSEAFEEASRLAEETLRNLAVQIHNEAKKTELDETYAAAKAIYADYLQLFPDAPEAYDLRFFDGELLYGLGEKPAAAALYEAVVRQDLAAMKRKDKQAGAGKWLQKAAWSAVLSRSEAAGDVDPQPQGKGAAAKGAAAKGAAAKGAPATPAPKSAQRALTPPEQLLAKACLLYLEALPEGPHAVEVAFKVGRLEYVAQQLDEAQKHLAWVATQHPENELAEYAANLVLDIANLRHDYPGMHAWALKFLADGKLIRHGTLAQDLKRIEEESAYAIADATASDPKKAQALLAFVDAHPHGDLTDKAIFGASAALSRAGRIDDALAARTRLWKEQGSSLLVPRALLASAADHSALGDFGEAAALLEKYAAGWKKQDEAKKWRRDHPRPPGSKPPPPGPVYEESKAQSGLHDAAVLREARGELNLALADRTLSLTLWKKPEGRDDALFAQAMLRAKLGQRSQAARDLAEIARQAHDKPSLRLTAWRESARLFQRIRETDHAKWAWSELEHGFKALGPKARAALSSDATAAAAEAHLALGGKEFEDFKQQQIKAPLMATLNRKIALLQHVKKRAEETVAMRQAEPAVCALVELGEAQMLLGQALATSPFPPGLRTAEQRKLYRDAINEKAQPIFADAKETLASADARAHELGVAGPCTVKTAALLDKLGGKAAARPELELGNPELAPVPGYVDADGVEIASEESAQ
jgi:TolA-binding protein